MSDEFPTILDVVILLLTACAALVALSDIAFSFRCHCTDHLKIHRQKEISRPRPRLRLIS